MTWRFALSAVIELLGLAAVVFGVALFSAPAAVIAAGLVVVLIGAALGSPGGKAPKR